MTTVPDPDTSPSAALFPRLQGGPRRMPAQRVADHQKARLEGAMIAAVSRHGYAGTTVHELVALAGVSKSTFYDHFASKQECFLATFDAVTLEATRRIGEAYRSSGDFRESMISSLAAFMDLVVDEPAAASLAAAESLTLGSAGVAHRERASEVFERLSRRSFGEAPGGREVSDIVVRAVVNGVAGIVYRRMRTGRIEELPKLSELLVDWAIGYRAPDGPALTQAMAASEVPPTIDPLASADEAKAAWDEPPDSPLSRTTLSQRERILRAAAWVVVEQGYPGLSIPAISAAAGTSNQTFYEHFADKQEALLAAYEVIAAEALSYALRAFEQAGDGPEAIGTGVRALTEHIACHRMFARLAFFELPAAGPAALDRADFTMDSVTAFLEPPLAPSGIGGPVPKATLEAIGTGIWAVIQREIANDRGSSLPLLAPELTRIALAPLQNAPH
ncbi:MAG TPA: TetR/AcrR family transcriptional regulator [Solirubrobacterales bacterium]|jgi:AcrR family transcriptional regulator|nr:TetR/AcrR family transcriptional regulator [Solirubrobacterales bacterium]